MGGAGLVIRDLVVKNDKIVPEGSCWTTGERREPADIGGAAVVPEVESIPLPTTADNTPYEQDDSSAAAAIEPPEYP